MTATVNVTEAQCFTVLRSFLIGILPAGIEVLRTQGNRVPEPAGSNFVLMTEMGRERLETNIDTYADGYFNAPATPGLLNVMQPTKLTIQIDAHGNSASENIQLITTLFRSGYACDIFAASGFDVTPLFTGEPHQAPYVNAEQQVEPRWSVDLSLQANLIVTVGQQFAGALQVGLIDVDVTYPAT